eukprot:Lankesteria_metandrocarpae@DN1536_c0_g1_i1.p1
MIKAVACLFQLLTLSNWLLQSVHGDETHFKLQTEYPQEYYPAIKRGIFKWFSDEMFEFKTGFRPDIYQMKLTKGALAGIFTEHEEVSESFPSSTEPAFVGYMTCVHKDHPCVLGVITGTGLKYYAVEAADRVSPGNDMHSSSMSRRSSRSSSSSRHNSPSSTPEQFVFRMPYNGELKGKIGEVKEVTKEYITVLLYDPLPRVVGNTKLDFVDASTAPKIVRGSTVEFSRIEPDNDLIAKIGNTFHAVAEGYDVVDRCYKK